MNDKNSWIELERAGVLTGARNPITLPDLLEALDEGADPGILADAIRTRGLRVLPDMSEVNLATVDITPPTLKATLS